MNSFRMAVSMSRNVRWMITCAFVFALAACASGDRIQRRSIAGDSSALSALREIEKSGDAASLDNEFERLVSHGSPVIEDVPGNADVRDVTFLFRATPSARNAVVYLSTFAWSDFNQCWMERLGKSALWFKKIRMRADARQPYGFAQDVPDRLHANGDNYKSFVELVNRSRIFRARLLRLGNFDFGDEPAGSRRLARERLRDDVASVRRRPRLRQLARRLRRRPDRFAEAVA